MTRTFHRRSRKGYVLLLTLLTIAISSLLLVAFARFSLNHAIETNMIENELQRKWGVASIQRVGMDRANGLLNRRSFDEETQSWQTIPQRESRAEFQLGGKVFSVILADESAKADVNLLLQSNVPESKIKKVIGKLSKTNLNVHLQPFKNPRTAKEQPIDSLNQLFSARDRELEPTEVYAASRNITCWSNRLNYKTAADETLDQVVGALVGQAAGSQILSLRKQEPDKPLQEVIQSIQATPQTIRTLTRSLSETSVSQSIWIRVQDRDADSYSFLVRKTVAGSVKRFSAFSW